MLITPAELAELIVTQPLDHVILDVRWTLGQSEQDNLANFLDGHIPSSIHVDLDHDLSAPADSALGRHPLPEPQDWAAKLRSWGLDNDSRVIVYDASGGASAARAWWMLRWAGLHTVRILDGGWTRWTAEGHRVAVGPGNVIWPGTFQFVGPSMPTTDIDGAAAWPEDGILLDARAHGRFTGHAAHLVDRRAGHIPGARSMPSEELVNPDATFKSPEELRELLAARGVREPEDAVKVAAYCGSGVTAAHLIFAMELAGLPGATMYPGSWSQWAEDISRPVAVGE